MIIMLLHFIYDLLSQILIIFIILCLMRNKIEKVKIIKVQHTKSDTEQSFALSETLLGYGKYSKVYKAVSMDDPNRIFAVKAIKINKPQDRQQYLKQLKIIKALPDCPNIVRISEQHIQSQNHIYIFQQFCQGGSFYDYYTSRVQPFSEAQMFDIFFQVFIGFRQLYKSKIIHQDIKPSNILLKHPIKKQYGLYMRNVYKICDFGVSELASQCKMSKIRKGTISYMPIEKLKNGDFVPNIKSQIFSLGVTLYQIFFKKHPYLESRVSNYQTYLDKILKAKLRPLQSVLSKQHYKCMSLKFEKFYQILERMLELKESKRISYEELEDYFNNSQPFKSMRVEQIKELDQIITKISSKNVTYDVISSSVTYMLNEPQQIQFQKAFFTNQNKIQHELINLHYSFIKKAISYFSFGINTLRKSGYLILKDFYKKKNQQSCLESAIESISKINWLEMTISYLNYSIVRDFERKYEQFFKARDEDEIKFLLDDAKFLENQFFKYYAEIDMEDKKRLYQQIKEAIPNLPNLICCQLKSLMNSIKTVRINFHEDIQGLYFIKFAPQIFQFVKKLQKSDLTSETTLIMEEMPKNETIIQQFQEIKKCQLPQLWKRFEKDIKCNHQILEDCQENSDQVEILNDRYLTQELQEEVEQKLTFY